MLPIVCALENKILKNCWTICACITLAQILLLWIILPSSSISLKTFPLSFFGLQCLCVVSSPSAKIETTPKEPPLNASTQHSLFHPVPPPSPPHDSNKSHPQHTLRPYLRRCIRFLWHALCHGGPRPKARVSLITFITP